MQTFRRNIILSLALVSIVAVGETVILTVNRGGKELLIPVTLAKRPAQ